MKNEPIRCFNGNAQPHEPFWRFVDAADSKSGQTELELYGVISEFSWFNDEITPKRFKEDLNRIGKNGPVLLRIDSPGGDVFAASAISSIITSYPGKVTAQVDGLAASAAVLVALAGESVRIMDSAYMMVHDPAVVVLMAQLDIELLGKLRDALQVIKDGIVPAYAQRTGRSQEEIAQMMADETWMNAQAAVELGFANEVIASGQKRNQAGIKNISYVNLLQQYEHVPEILLEEEVEPDAEIVAADDGLEPVESAEPETVTAQVRPSDRARLAVSAKKSNYTGAKIMNVRDLQKQRGDLLDEATALADLADKENRDFTDEERERFNAIVGDEGEIDQLDAKIAQITEERTKLEEKALKQVASKEPVKPDNDENDRKVMKRAEYAQLSPREQIEFTKNGGRVIE